MWTRQSHGQIIGGATPGKIVMGIRILYVEAVVPLDPIPPVDINLNQLNHTPLRALVFPGFLHRKIERTLNKLLY